RAATPAGSRLPGAWADRHRASCGRAAPWAARYQPFPAPERRERIFRRSGHRFADKNMRQSKRACSDCEGTEYARREPSDPRRVEPSRFSRRNGLVKKRLLAAALAIVGLAASADMVLADGSGDPAPAKGENGKYFDKAGRPTY